MFVFGAASTALLLAVFSAAPAALATSSGISIQEAPGVREALARQLQLPGPAVVSQGASGGSGEETTPEGVLVPKLATAFSNTWSAPGKPLVTRIFDAPVNYKDANGAWRPIDNSLTASPLGGYENTANGFSLRLPNSLSSALSLTYRGQALSFTLDGASGRCRPSPETPRPMRACSRRPTSPTSLNRAACARSRR